MKQTAALKESINHNYYTDLLLISIVSNLRSKYRLLLHLGRLMHIKILMN